MNETMPPEEQSGAPGGETRRLQPERRTGLESEARRRLFRIYDALQEQGYDPIRQMAHYLLSGEPTYITAHRQARSLVRDLERDEILEELVRFYIENADPGEPSRDG